MQLQAPHPTDGISHTEKRNVICLLFQILHVYISFIVYIPCSKMKPVATKEISMQKKHCSTIQQIFHHHNLRDSPVQQWKIKGKTGRECCGLWQCHSSCCGPISKHEPSTCPFREGTSYFCCYAPLKQCMNNLDSNEVTDQKLTIKSHLVSSRNQHGWRWVPDLVVCVYICNIYKKRKQHPVNEV